MPSRLGLALAVALVSYSLTACGSGSSPSPTASRAASTPQTKPTSKPHAPSHPRLGATQIVRTPGATLAVTVSRVINPLAGSGAALQPGTHAVGVLVGIRNHGPGVYDSSATGDVSIVPSSGGATPVFAAHGVCQTPLRDFDNYITAGEVRHGCIAFSIDAGAKVAAVRFSPLGRAAGRATWAGH